MFDSLKILEIGSGIAAPYCGKLMSIMGAEVIKIEPMEGDESRRMGPFPKNDFSTDNSGLFIALNNGKKSVSVDIDSDPGERDLIELIRSSDIVIESNVFNSLENKTYSHPTLKRSNSGIIHLAITDFGSWGSRKNWKSSDLTLFHMSGNAHGMIGPVDNPDVDPPIRAGGYQAEFVSGLTACTALMMAIFRRNMTGLGGYLEVSKYEAMVTQTIAGLANMAFGGSAPERDLRKVKEASIGGMVGAIGGVLPTSDGYIAISPREDDQWLRWVELMGSPSWSQQARFSTRSGRQQNYESLWEYISAWTRNYSKHEITRWGQENHIPCFPVNTVDDLFGDEQFSFRNFFVETDHPVLGTLKIPGVPYKLSGMDLHLIGSPAPFLGQHNKDLLGHS